MIIESRLHLYIHPILQLTGIFFGYVALFWGVQRFLASHMEKKIRFPWKQHVQWGKIASVLWLIGVVVGLYSTHAAWNNIRITGEHYTVGILLVPLILATLGTGYWMEKFKKKRQYLCLVHGILGGGVCLLAFLQMITGVQVFAIFVW